MKTQRLSTPLALQLPVILFMNLNFNVLHLLPRRACLWVALGLLTALLATLAQPARAAAVTEAWVQRYNNLVSNSVDQAFKVVRDAAGDIIVTGYTDDGTFGLDMLTIKYSGADGSVLWQKRHDGPAHSDDQAQALAVDSGGNVIVAGGSATGYDSFGNPIYDYYTAKYAAADGALLWEKRYNGPANRDDQAQAVAVDGGGNVIVTGFSMTGNNSFGDPIYDYYTAKYAAANGALLWEKRYNGPANGSDSAYAVALDGSGNVVVTGASATGYDSFGDPIYDYYTAKYAAADGALLWEKRYNGPGNRGDNAQAVAVDGSGNVVVTGYSDNGTNGYNDYYTAKYAAADGALLWEKRYNGPANESDSASAVAVDGSGNVVVTGSSYNGTNSDYYTAKYAAADGVLLWEKRYNGPANSDDQAQAVAVDGSGNVVVTGTSGSLPNSDYYTAKYAAADGALLWEKRYNSPGNRGDNAQAVAVDGSGNVVVTGSSVVVFDSFGNSHTDYYTAKYASANGAPLWEKRYNGPANNDDLANAVVVDSSGNVVVTGLSIGSNFSFDYYTAKYAGGNGALLWEKRYNGPGNSYDEAHAVAVDGSGNVVVTGLSGNIFSPDYYTAKYAATNGALLWEKRYNGPASGEDQALALAVDGSGNVVVTGYSFGSGSGADYYTAKYAAADGALLWQKRYNSPSNELDLAVAVAVDGSGNVIVTGYSYNGPNFVNADYYTAKYAAADGALLWEKRYNGPANNDDYAQAVAVDGSNNVVVTGYSNNGGDYFDTDYYTAKYAAANGALLWEKRYNGPANGEDQAHAVAVDGSGNVVVTGYSYNSSGNPDYYTAKYAAANGALLWGKRGPVGVASALAVDSNGNVVVTGSSYNGTNSDYYTAKYAAANGAVLWEKRYNGPANGDDSVNTLRSLALGPNGMVAITGYSDANFRSGTPYDYATVVYRENQPPVITCPANSMANCSGGDGAVADFTVTATDDSGVPPTLTCVPPSGSLFPIGQTTVTCTARDGDSAPSTCTFTVTVVDTTPPAIACNSNLVVECTSPAGAIATFTATAVDVCDANPVVVCSPTSGSSFPLGPTTVTCTATDTHANSSSCSFTVSVVDTMAPIITCPSNITVEFTSEAGAVVTYSVTAADICDLAPLVACVPPSGSTFPIGATEVHCAARDASGNSNSCSFAVTVLGARGALENILAELIALRATVTDPEDGKKLDEAIEHLIKSLDSELWVDQNHLERKHGDKVFHEDKETVKKLCDLLTNNQSNIPEAVLQGFVDRIFRADRLLASVAIQEAIAAGASRKKIEHAQKHLAKGDARAGDDKCDNGIEDYRNAWKHAVRAKLVPPVHLANGRMQLEILGEPGERFTIQASSNLVDWVTIGAGTANAEGVVTFEDADAGRHPARYYRALSE